MKKDFKKISPAMQFVSNSREEFKEKKTKRLHLLLEPSLYEKIRKKAFDKKVSMNKIIYEFITKNLV